MAERNLIKRGDHVWTGGAGDSPRKGWVLVDVQNLPESPSSYRDISLQGVMVKFRRIESAVADGKDVLVRCAHGVSRSPTIAKLYLQSHGESFNDKGYFPNDSWKEFARVYGGYFKKQASG